MKILFTIIAFSLLCGCEINTRKEGMKEIKTVRITAATGDGSYYWKATNVLDYGKDGIRFNDVSDGHEVRVFGNVIIEYPKVEK